MFFVLIKEMVLLTVVAYVFVTNFTVQLGLRGLTEVASYRILEVVLGVHDKTLYKKMNRMIISIVFKKILQREIIHLMAKTK